MRNYYIYSQQKNGFNSSKLTNVIGKRNHYGTFAEKTETHTRGTSTASYFTMTFEMWKLSRRRSARVCMCLIRISRRIHATCHTSYIIGYVHILSYMRACAIDSNVAMCRTALSSHNVCARAYTIRHARESSTMNFSQESRHFGGRLLPGPATADATLVTVEPLPLHVRR